MIAEIVRIASFLLPIPFMALFYIKTNKLDFLKKYYLLLFFIPVFAQIVTSDLGYNIELIITYMILVLFGTTIFNKNGWNLPQAISLSFCLAYFGSFLWELPTHIYTMIIRGGIDGAFPLHLLYIFPMIFVYEKVKTNLPRIEILKILLPILGFMTFALFSLVTNDVDIWNIQLNSMFDRVMTEWIWMICRMITISGLILIYSRSTLRKVKKT